MAATELTVQTINRAGLALALAAANADGHLVDNQGDRRMFIVVRNGGGSEVTVTVASPVTVDGLAVADLGVSIPAGGERWIGPFPASIYNSAGQIAFGVSAVDGVTVAAVRLPNG